MRRIASDPKQKKDCQLNHQTFAEINQLIPLPKKADSQFGLLPGLDEIDQADEKQCSRGHCPERSQTLWSTCLDQATVEPCWTQPFPMGSWMVSV